MVRHKNPVPGARDRIATAPYNFVPLPNAVLTVDPANGFSAEVDGQARPVWECHDRYVNGLFSGKLDLTVETVSPLFIRGPLTRNGDRWDDRETRRRPENVVDANGRPQIPGSTFRGMVRSLVEILSFAKPQPVSRRRPFFRSVGDDRMAREYRDRIVRNNAKPTGGFVHRTGGGWLIQPAAATLRVSHPTIEEARNNTAPELAPFVYELNPRYKPQPQFQHRHCWVLSHDNNTVSDLSFSPKDDAGWREGVLVLTGAAGARTSKEKSEFVFLLSNRSTPSIPIPDEMWERFHDEDQITQWQEQAFRRNQPVTGARRRDGALREGEAVFYVTEVQRCTPDNPRGLLFFGRAQLFRLPYDVSPNDLIPPALHSGLDLAEVIFGCIAESDREGGRTIRGRVRCSDLSAVQRPGDDYFEPVTVPSILASPKPTAFQQYLVQDGTSGKESLKTYFRDDGTTIRGHKVYWRRWDAGAGLQAVKTEQHDVIRADLLSEGSAQDKQHTVIRPVRAGITFKGSIAFENLTNVELGALLTALVLPEGCAHSIGMGKPLGLGVIRVTPRLILIDRQKRYSAWTGDGTSEKSPDDFLAAFSSTIALHAKKTGETLVGDGIWGIGRLNALRALLEYPPKASRDDTRYLRIQNGDASRYRDGKEFRDRPVLPTPHFVASLPEPQWNDLDAPPEPQRMAERHASIARREVVAGDFVDVVVREDKAKGDRPKFDVLKTGQIGILDPTSWGKLPPELSVAGARVKLKVVSGGKTPQLAYVDPAAPPSPKASQPKQKGSGPKRR